MFVGRFTSGALGFNGIGCLLCTSIENACKFSDSNYKLRFRGSARSQEPRERESYHIPGAPLSKFLFTTLISSPTCISAPTTISLQLQQQPGEGIYQTAHRTHTVQNTAGTGNTS